LKVKTVSERSDQITLSQGLDDIDLLLMPCSELVRLGLRSYILWEKDVHQFFRRLHTLHALQEQLLVSLLEQWQDTARQDESYPTLWKDQLQRAYDLLLPEQATCYLLNPYRASLLL